MLSYSGIVHFVKMTRQPWFMQERSWKAVRRNPKWHLQNQLPLETGERWFIKVTCECSQPGSQISFTGWICKFSETLRYVHGSSCFINIPQGTLGHSQWRGRYSVAMSPFSSFGHATPTSFVVFPYLKQKCAYPNKHSALQRHQAGHIKRKLWGKNILTREINFLLICLFSRAWPAKAGPKFVPSYLQITLVQFLEYM